MATRLELERIVENRRQAEGRNFEKEHSMDECVERLTGARSFLRPHALGWLAAHAAGYSRQCRR